MIFTFSTLFFVLIVSLLVERYFDFSKLRHWGWVKSYHALIDRRFAGKSSITVVLIMTLPIALLISILELNLRLWLYGVLGIVFEFIILLYCLGPRSAWQDIETIKGLPSEDQAITLLDVETTSFHSGIWLMFARRILSPILWFILLGAGGVFFYRMIEVAFRLLSKKSETALFADRAKIILNGLDWLPIRIFGIIFALAGHFTLVIKEWKKRAWSSVADNEALLSACGEAGLRMTEQTTPMDYASFVKEVAMLIERSLIIFNVILAFLVLILW